MKIKYTIHLKKRLEVRNIPKSYPRMVYKNPENRFFDVEEENHIAIKKLDYNGKERYMMIAYETGEVVEIITIHPISENQIKNRVRKGRWKLK